MDISRYQATGLLDAEWQKWLAESLSLNVPVENIAETLATYGHHDAAQALLADFSVTAAAGKPLPQIDTSRNSVQLRDACPHIIFTCDKPVVVVLDNFLTDAECDALIAAAENKFHDATVVDAMTGDFVRHRDRTSTNAVFKRSETELVHAIEARIAEVIHWPAENGEGMQVLRYAIGAEYKSHFDYFDPKLPGELKNLARGGQRVGTFLMYLSDVEAGGATRFPVMKFEIRPKKGMALYFGDMLANGEGDKLSLHAGTPVISGTKYLATKWLREGVFI